MALFARDEQKCELANQSASISVPRIDQSQTGEDIIRQVIFSSTLSVSWPGQDELFSTLLLTCFKFAVSNKNALSAADAEHVIFQLWAKRQGITVYSGN